MTDAATSPGSTEPLPRRGFVLLAALTLLWGVNWPMLKLALNELPVLTFRGSCLFFAGLVIIALHCAIGRSIKVPRRQWRPLLITGFFNITVWHLATGFGLVYTTSGRASIIAYTMPIWTVPVGYLVLGERPGWRRLSALGLGSAGLGVLIATDAQTLSAAPLGPLLVLVGAVGWACGTVALKRTDWQVSMWVLVGWQCLICGLPIFVAAAVVDADTVQFPSLWPLVSVIYNIFAPFVICYYIYYEIVRMFPTGGGDRGHPGNPDGGAFQRSPDPGRAAGLERVHGTRPGHRGTRGAGDDAARELRAQRVTGGRVRGSRAPPGRESVHMQGQPLNGRRGRPYVCHSCCRRPRRP